MMRVTPGGVITTGIASLLGDRRAAWVACPPGAAELEDAPFRHTEGGSKGRAGV